MYGKKRPDKSKKYNSRELSEIYNVSKTTILRIIKEFKNRLSE